MIISVALGIVLAVAIIAALVWYLLPTGIVALLIPRTPNTAFVPDCSVPNTPANAALGPNLTSGVVRGQQITVAANTTLRLSGDLTLISTGDLKINGSILNGPTAATGSDFSHSITLVSLNGSVIIGPNARIGFDTATVIAGAAPLTGGNIKAAPGNTGGWIKIVAQNGAISNAGTILGFPGSPGQDATDNQPAAVVAIPGGGIAPGLSASCAAGGGGDGGHVGLCALDGINNSGLISGGGGGTGGAGTATAGNYRDAEAVGGPGGTGGSVLLHGLANPGPVGVTNNGTMAGGLGGSGGRAVSAGGNAGGDATASAGNAGAGGAVRFTNVEMAVVGTLNAASGGNGGLANAAGGAGANNQLWGWSGGSGTATGGDGGADGPMPQIPVPPPGVPAPTWGPVLVGFPTPSGIGGNATVTAGNGGSGRLGASNSGGRNVTGGTGKSGAAATPIAILPAPPVGGAGGVGGTSTSAGTP